MSSGRTRPSLWCVVPGSSSPKHEALHSAAITIACPVFSRQRAEDSTVSSSHNGDADRDFHTFPRELHDGLAKELQWAASWDKKVWRDYENRLQQLERNGKIIGRSSGREFLAQTNDTQRGSFGVNRISPGVAVTQKAIKSQPAHENTKEEHEEFQHPSMNEKVRLRRQALLRERQQARSQLSKTGIRPRQLKQDAIPVPVSPQSTMDLFPQDPFQCFPSVDKDQQIDRQGRSKGNAKQSSSQTRKTTSGKTVSHPAAGGSESQRVSPPSSPKLELFPEDPFQVSLFPSFSQPPHEKKPEKGKERSPRSTSRASLAAPRRVSDLKISHNRHELYRKVNNKPLSKWLARKGEATEHPYLLQDSEHGSLSTLEYSEHAESDEEPGSPVGTKFVLEVPELPRLLDSNKIPRKRTNGSSGAGKYRDENVLYANLPSPGSGGKGGSESTQKMTSDDSSSSSDTKSDPIPMLLEESFTESTHDVVSHARNNTPPRSPKSKNKGRTANLRKQSPPRCVSASDPLDKEVVVRDKIAVCESPHPFDEVKPARVGRRRPVPKTTREKQKEERVCPPPEPTAAHEMGHRIHPTSNWVYRSRAVNMPSTATSPRQSTIGWDGTSKHSDELFVSEVKFLSQFVKRQQSNELWPMKC